MNYLVEIDKKTREITASEFPLPSLWEDKHFFVTLLPEGDFAVCTKRTGAYIDCIFYDLKDAKDSIKYNREHWLFIEKENELTPKAKEAVKEAKARSKNAKKKNVVKKKGKISVVVYEKRENHWQRVRSKSIEGPIEESYWTTWKDYLEKYKYRVYLMAKNGLLERCFTAFPDNKEIVYFRKEEEE